MTTLGKLVVRVDSNGPDPAREAFEYIDLSSIDSKTKTISEPRELLTVDAPSRARQRVKSGDILVSTVRPNLNSVAQVPNELDGAIASTGFTVLRVDEGQLHSRYLFHWVQTDAFVNALVRLTTGASYPAVSDKIVKGLGIPLPPLPEQRRIASILDQVDALRTKRRRAHALLDRFSEATFDAILREDIDGKGDAVTLGEVADIQTGPFGSLLHREEYVSGGVPLVNPTHINGGQIKIDPEYSITDEKFESLRAYELREGDVVLGRRGEMGRAAEVPGSNGRLVCGTGSMILRPKPGVVTGAVLANILRSKAVRDQLTQRAQGVTMLNLNQKIVEGIAVVLPVFEKQMTVSQLKTTTQVAKMRHVRHLAHLDELFSTFQDLAFKG